MPSKRARFRDSRAGSVLARIGRLAGVLLVGGFGLFALTLLAVRFVVFPQVERYRDTLATALSAQLDRPVEIAVLATGWDGWNPKLIVEGFRVLDRGRAVTTPLIELPVVELVVAWTSLPLLELRLKELVIQRPRLAIRRDRAGMLHIAGFEIDPAQATEDRTLTDWLLRQRHIVVRDALITWNDDLRNAPQLVLDRVQFRMQNRLGHHRFGLTGTPPAEIAAPIDVRGDLRNLSSREWQRARGSLYVRLDYADVAAWREWLPLPIPLASGKGALRVWLEVDRGAAREIVADLELAEVSTQLGERLPRLDLPHLTGRVEWRSEAAQHAFSARGLAFATAAGQRLGPTDMRLELNDAADGRDASGRLDFDRLELAPLRDLASHLPLPEELRANLVRFAPRGTVSRASVQWQGAVDAPVAYSGAADFANLGMLPYAAFPGVTGLSGHVDTTQEKGELRIASRNVELAAPRVFAEAIAFATLDALLAWERKPDGTTVRAQKFEFASADATGSAAGTYRSADGGGGDIDANAQIASIDVARLYRFLPVAAREGVHRWLRTALVRGTLADLRLRLAGKLAEIPFAGGRKGQLLLTAKAKDVLLDYAPDWPAISGIDADLRVDGARLTIDAARGHVFGAEFGRTRAEIPDVTAPHPLLRVEGTAAGPAADFLRFVAQSPVAEWIDHLTDGAEATGEGRLALRLGLSLGHLGDHKVAGEFTFVQGQLRLPHAPALAGVNGTLVFSETDVRADGVSAEVLGGPATLALASGDGRVRVTGSGRASIAQVRREFVVPYGERVSGNVDWSIGVNLRPQLSWVLESTLQGVAVDLPAPLGKSAAQAVPLRVERRGDAVHPGQDFMVASYGRAAAFAAHRQETAAGAIIDRAQLSLGRAAERADASRAERPGFWLRADLGALDVDEWLVLARREKEGATGPAEAGMVFAGADLKVGELNAFGVRLNDVSVAARKSPDGVQLDIQGADLAGTATWSEPSPALPAGRIAARLTRFSVPGKGELGPQPARDTGARGVEPKGETAIDNAWPELDIAAESLVSKGRDLGSLELRAYPRVGEWRIQRLALANDTGRIEASGEWRVAGQEQQTRLDVALDAKDAGDFLARFGYPDAMDGAATKISGHLAWAGTPAAIDYPTLSGAFGVEVGPGRFSRIEPGIGKLLGVLSLQALPRRMTLDFRDIFSEGFTFDRVTGNVRIASGVMTTRDLKLVGPAAQVEIAGEADLARESQRLTVRVQPSLSGGVSTGAALLFFANPLVGAAVGAGSLLAQKMFKDPIEQMFSYEYVVTGSWSDPVVTRSGSATASVAPGTPAISAAPGAPGMPAASASPVAPVAPVERTAP